MMVLWLVALAAMAFGAVYAGYFSGFETGLYTVNRIRLRCRREQGDPRAAALTEILRRPRRAIATTLVGHNLCVYLVTTIATRLSEGVWPDRAGVVSALLLALPLFLLAEVIPKEVTRRAADTLPYRLAPSFRLAERLFWPATAVLTWVARGLGWLLGPRVALADWAEAHRLRYYLALGRRSGVLSAEQTRMADNILRLARRSVAQVMVPLDRVETLAEEAGEQEALACLRRSTHRRVLLYRGRRDQVVGVVARLELLLTQEQAWPERMRQAVRPVFRTAAETTVLEALEQLRRQECPLAAVEGGRGQVVGLVTVGDLVEEIVGELSPPGKGAEPGLGRVGADEK